MKHPASNLVTAIATAAVTAVAVAAVMTTADVATADPGSGREPANSAGPLNLGNFDYGVCRGIDAACYHDWGNFNPANGFPALLLTRTARPRHADPGPP